MAAPYPFFWRYALREARRRPGRSALTLLGVALSVAAVTAITSTIEATRGAYSGGLATLADGARLEVVRPGGQGAFPWDARRQAAVEAVHGVQSAVPVVESPAALITAEGPVSLYVVGLGPGASSPPPAGLQLTQAFAKKHGLAPGAWARLSTPRGPSAVEVTRLISPHGPASFNGGAVAFLPLDRAQALFTAPGEVTAVRLVLTGAVPEDEVARSAGAVLPGLDVQPPGRRASLANDFLASTEHALSTLGVIATVCGALVSLNTLLMQFAERRRPLALLRALGATSRQVTGLLVRQGLLLGGLGALLGVPVGVGLAALLLRVYEWSLALAMPPAALSLRAVALAVLVGPLLACLTTLVPAYQAAREPPLAGISLRGRASGERRGHWLTWLGAALLAGVAIFLLGLVQGWVTARVGTAVLPLVVASALVGCACLLPLVLPALLHAAARLLAPCGMEARLAVRHLLYHPARTALTSNVLFAALVVSLSVGNSFLNGVSDIETWYENTIGGAFLVRAVRPDPAMAVAAAAMPDAVAREARRLPGVGGVGRLRFITTRVGETPVMLIAREIAQDGPLPMAVLEGDPAEARAALRRGEALLGSALAMRLGATVGDHVSVETRDGPRALRVAAIVKEYTVGGMALYLDYEPARGHFGFAGPHAVAVDPAPGQEEALAVALAEYCRDRGLVLQSPADFGRTIRRVITGVNGIIVGLVLLVCLVAALGVVNTLTTNVLDQTRELGALRAVGLLRGQLRRLVVWQAVLLALISAVPGLPTGLLLAWLMNRTTPALVGQFVPFHAHLGLAAVCVAGLVALAALAALAPACRAARLAVIDALRYE